MAKKITEPEATKVEESTKKVVSEKKEEPKAEPKVEVKEAEPKKEEPKAAPVVVKPKVPFLRWFKSKGFKPHWRAGMEAYADTSKKRTLEEWETVFKNY